ncbi:MAG: META domain-containing protein [Candidatus Thiothrix putei]|uniref:META domain-containing protein n=1 Tax=Candidatus Thiothrix putei TaxID=3080811 RepID=A0AA95KLM3_9GAMM|nr:MAG: META domain-containing protein [Candidatus Thiothrix putei]
MLKVFFSSLTGQIISALVFLSIISACSFDAREPAPGMTLANTSWTLKTLDGKPVTTDKLPTIQFDDTRMNGYSGCNQFFGNYTSSSDGIFTTSAVGATKMACLDDKNALEQQFFAQLEKANKYAVTREQLHLLDHGRNILMVLNAAKPAADKAK